MNKYNSGRFNVITGLRRSGTSMLMLSLRQSGIPTIGFRYSMDKLEVEKDIKMGNPTGFWEVGIITKERGLPPDCGWIGLPGDIIKVMCECLYKSEAKMVNKAVIIMREPSQMMTSILKWNDIKFKDMFIINTAMDLIDSIGFLKFNKKQFIFTFYEDILSNPKQELKRICNFLGNGQYFKGAKWIQPKLNRSKKKKYSELHYLETIYKLAKQNKVNEIINFQLKLKIRGQELLKQYGCEDQSFPRLTK